MLLHGVIVTLFVVFEQVWLETAWASLPCGMHTDTKLALKVLRVSECVSVQSSARSFRDS